MRDWASACVFECARLHAFLTCSDDDRRRNKAEKKVRKMNAVEWRERYMYTDRVDRKALLRTNLAQIQHQINS